MFSYNSFAFIFIFLPIALLLYFNPLVNSQKKRNYVLMFMSVLFYMLAEPKYFMLPIIILLVTVLCGRWMLRASHKGAKAILVLAVSFQVVLLLFYKYIHVIPHIHGVFGDAVDQIVLPLGISYYSFQAISFLADTYSNRENNPVFTWNEAALYLFSFPHVVMGPILQYHDAIGQIRKRSQTVIDIENGLERFAIGMIKKAVLADSLSVLTQQCFTAESMSVGTAWLGAAAFSLQLFFDFSGFSDMAIGLGRIFGFRFCENFNYPYCAKSVTDFWRRWHMSLTSWFTKYIYIPLGGSRVGSKARHLLNLFVVWLCTGVWHGSKWTFIVWAMYYFVLQVMEKYTILKKIPSIPVVGHVYGLTAIIIGMVMFHSNTVLDAIQYWKVMFGINAVALADHQFVVLLSSFWAPLAAGCICSFPIEKFITDRLTGKAENTYRVIRSLFVIVLFFLSACLIISNTYAPAIYAGF